MNSNEFVRRLLKAEPDSPEAAALARDLVEDARYPAKLALERYLSSSNEDDQIKAKNILADLREFALVPLAETARGPNIDNDVWIMRTITDALVALHARSACILKDLLSDQRPRSQGGEGSLLYQLPPSTRVCDLAFVLLCSILHLESPSPEFFNMPSADRDKRIKEFQKSREFRTAFESPL